MRIVRIPKAPKPASAEPYAALTAYGFPGDMTTPTIAVFYPKERLEAIAEELWSRKVKRPDGFLDNIGVTLRPTRAGGLKIGLRAWDPRTPKRPFFRQDFEQEGAALAYEHFLDRYSTAGHYLLALCPLSEGRTPPHPFYPRFAWHCENLKVVRGA